MKILRTLVFTAAMGALGIQCGGAPAVAQSSASQEALQAATNLVSIVSGSMVSDVITRTTSQVWPRIESAVRTQNPKIDAATIAQLRQQFERLIVSSISDVMKEAPAIYMRYFTAQEMRDIVAFYRTPTGAKALKVMPQASADLLASMTPRLQGLEEKVNLAFLNILQQRGFYAQ
jgi:uncharacterized protein